MAECERDLDTRMVGITVKREVHRAVLKEFGRPEDEGYVAAYRRALIEAVGDVKLTADDYREIAEELERAMEDRMAKRRGEKIERNLTRKEAAGITQTVVDAQIERLNREETK